MDPEAFKAALEKVKPSAESLMTEGLSRDFALEFMSSFEVRDRDRLEQNSLSDRTLNELFSRYDVSNIEIGMVRFCKNPRPVRRGWQIGQFEADDLILDADSGGIIVLSIEAIDHVMSRCAKDGSSLLAALARAAKFYEDFEDDDPKSMAVHTEALEDCILAAGGQVYANFYRMLLGVE